MRPARSFELYPETVGGPELIGSFTVYTTEIYDNLSRADCDELLRINTAPLPSRLFASSYGDLSVDDGCVHATATAELAFRRPIGGSRTIEGLPQLGALHSESWPQDRPIARALAGGSMVIC